MIIERRVSDNLIITFAKLSAKTEQQKIIHRWAQRYRQLLKRELGVPFRGGILKLLGFQSWETAIKHLNQRITSDNINVQYLYLDLIDRTRPLNVRFRWDNLRLSQRKRGFKFKSQGEGKFEREEIERLGRVVEDLRIAMEKNSRLPAPRIHAILRKCLNNQSIGRAHTNMFRAFLAYRGITWKSGNGKAWYEVLDHENQNSSEVDPHKID